MWLPSLRVFGFGIYCMPQWQPPEVATSLLQVRSASRPEPLVAAVLQLERHLRRHVMTKAWRGRRPAPLPQPVAPATPKLAQEVTPAALALRASDWRRQEVLKQQALQEPEQRRRSSRQAGKRCFVKVLPIGSQGSSENLSRLPASRVHHCGRQ